MEGEDSPLPSPVARYRIVCQPSGEWHPYRDEQLINIERDPERSPPEEIFLWATRVFWAEDRLTVPGWTEAAQPWGGPVNITVIGCGRPGVPYAAGMASLGHHVLGLDTDPAT